MPYYSCSDEDSAHSSNCQRQISSSFDGSDQFEYHYNNDNLVYRIKNGSDTIKYLDHLEGKFQKRFYSNVMDSIVYRNGLISKRYSFLLEDGYPPFLFDVYHYFHDENDQMIKIYYYFPDEKTLRAENTYLWNEGNVEFHEGISYHRSNISRVLVKYEYDEKVNRLQFYPNFINRPFFKNKNNVIYQLDSIHINSVNDFLCKPCHYNFEYDECDIPISQEFFYLDSTYKRIEFEYVQD